VWSGSSRFESPQGEGVRTIEKRARKNFYHLIGKRFGQKKSPAWSSLQRITGDAYWVWGKKKNTFHFRGKKNAKTRGSSPSNSQQRENGILKTARRTRNQRGAPLCRPGTREEKAAEEKRTKKYNIFVGQRST